MGTLAGLAAGEVAGLGPGGKEILTHRAQRLGAEAIRGRQLPDFRGLSGAQDRN